MSAVDAFHNEVDNYDYIPAEAHPECLQWASAKITDNLPVEAVSEADKEIITEFLVGDETKRALFAYLSGPPPNSDAALEVEEDSNGEAEAKSAPVPERVRLVLSLAHPNLASRNLPPGTVADVLWFVRLSGKTDVTPDNIDTALAWGVSRGGNAMDSFLRVMQSVLAPTLLRNKSAWPDSIQKDISNVMHKFMATLTENANRIKGSTVLYVPLENLDAEMLRDAHNDKELVQRFESAVIHWTRQIKEVVNEKDVEGASESEGPLAEIEYWRARTRDLNNIRKQFNRKDVLQIVEVLDRAKSFYYLEPFLSLKTDIEKGTEEAIDNLKYLNTLLEPCMKLSKAEPKEIAALLPQILRTTQLILIYSTHYKRDRFFRILRMISNEIINRCRKKVDLSAILAGNVEKSMVALQESIAAGETWMHACRKMLDATSKRWRSSKHEQLDVDDTIFNEIDGFVKHRCVHLIEVCKGQMQFGFKANTAKVELNPDFVSKDSKHVGLDDNEQSGEEPRSIFEGMLPCFGGSKGSEIESQLLDIQRGFKSKMEMLRHLNYDILDIKATRWNDDFRVLKADLDNLGTVMTQIIQSAFDSVVTVEAGAELLEDFFYLAKREELIQAVDRRKDGVIRIFVDELKWVQGELSRFYEKVPPIHESHPKYAGKAIWARTFRHRIEHNHRLLSRCTYLSDTGEKLDAMTLYSKVERQIDEYVNRQYNEWVAQLPDDPSILLDIFLVTREEQDNGVATLRLNFSTELLTMFEEVRFWQRLGFPIPHQVGDICTKEERLRVFRENVATVVRAYNGIISTLSSEDRSLFAQRIAFLDSKFLPGWTKLWWSSQGIVEYYVRECKGHADKLQATVNDFKLGVQYTQHLCKVIADTPVISIENKRTYDLEKFQERQRQQRAAVKEKVHRILDLITDRMAKMFDFFRADYSNESIRVEWHRFVMKVEKDIEDSLKLQGRRSLMEIEKALPSDRPGDKNNQGDKVEWQLFRLRVEAVSNTGEVVPSIETRPSVSDLKNAVTKVCTSVREVAEGANRVEERLTALVNGETDAELEEKKLLRVHYENPDAQVQGSYQEVMTHDAEKDNLVKRINGAFAAVAGKVEAKLKVTPTPSEERESRLWASNKQLNRIKKNQEHTSYKDYLDKVVRDRDDNDTMETITSVAFLQLDYSPLKEKYHNQCEYVIDICWKLLREEASSDVTAMLNSFDDVIKELSAEPATRNDLNRQSNLYTKAVADLPSQQRQFDPINAKFNLLAQDTRNGASLGPEWEAILKKREELPAIFDNYKVRLEECKRQLDTYKEQFKTDLDSNLRQFATHCEQLQRDLRDNGPYAAGLQSSEAFAKLAFYRRQIAEREAEEKKIHEGMDFFGMEKSVQSDLATAKADLDLLTRIWELTDSWRRNSDSWKKQPFKSLDSEQITDTVDSSRKAVLLLRKDLERREVWAKLREDIELFKRLLPVIDDLLIKSIRPRHWAQLADQLGVEEKFDTDSDDFNLDILLNLRVEKQAEFVVNLATAARQEAKIEIDLQKIEDTWRNMLLTIEPHQTQYVKIAGTDDIVNVLAEHITMLSSMKMSRFVESFKNRVQQWEQDLGVIGDTLEALLNVQGKWMYLENIFVGSEDIKRKLVSESKQFDFVHNQWIGVMGMLQREQLVMSGVKKVSIEQLNSMSSTLEQIQKSLEGFLEDRRRAFPRFYFLSNDDLLEILGHTKEPEKVQSHLRKCFEGLYQLSMKTLRNGRMVADAMFSADGEKVPFTNAVQVDNTPVEVWLRNVENKMRETVQARLNSTLDELQSKVYKPRRRIAKDDMKAWIHKNEGQCLITAASINWTSESERVISLYGELGGGGRRRASPVYKLYKKWKALIKNYCILVREPQDKFQRNKLVALITIEVHNRDILRSLQLARVSSLRDFDWSKQLRFYSEVETNEATDTESRICVIRQTSATVKYDYEYLGNSGRLVVTGLTDRAYMTLTNALKLFRGGLPQGPAGTGKTETVKDLGKAIAKYVMVFNCSDGLDYKSLGRMFSGLAQTGGWSCFDEFNRIEVEVLSVVAQQISCILSAVARREKQLLFEGVVIPLNLNCGIFVTMNPGYAGRSELPDNLKALLRPISMMTPDFALICEITLLSQGFEESETLSKKVSILYELMEKQLSKQDHYDFSLRNIKAVLVQAGNLKRENFPGTESQLCLKAMMDMNLPKFVKDDVPLFMGMLGDLFPGIHPEDAGLQVLRDTALVDLKENGYEQSEHIVDKVIHLWDTLRTRHGVMVVGQTGAGKTVTWKTLAGSLKRLREANANNGVFEAVKVSLLNPKSVTMDELYGSYNIATREWKDGILSELMRSICRDIKDPNYKWLLFDGPVDTLWIESMNTVLDDNKMLTLNSGERINLNPTVSMLFEVQDLSQASPATVSRCGMVFFNVEDLGWMPFINRWLRSRKNFEVAINAPKPESTIKELEDFIVTNVAKIIDFKRRECVELFPTTEINIVRSFTRMFDAIANPDAAPATAEGVPFPTAQAGESYLPHVRLVATFALLWTAGGSLTEDSRRKFDVAIREMDPSFPAAETSFEYFVDFRTHGWKHFDEHGDLQRPFHAEEGTPYHKIIVPTVDTVRYQYIVNQLVRNQAHVVLVGNTGTGKSLVANIVAQSFNQTHVTTQLNFSAQTSARNVQEIIEGKMEHKSKKLCSPPGGRRMVCLIEDLNMPAKEVFGAQPPLELLRQWMDNGFWYDRTTRGRRQVNEMQLLCCMTFGRPDITPRFMSKLNMLNITFPSENVITKIFSTILNWRFGKFPDLANYCDVLVKGTLQVYARVTTDLLPIPSKSHYLFNLRDLSKVFQGIFSATLELLETKDHLFTLWVHECMRVFQDRMNDPQDNIWFKNLICDKLATLFQTKWSTLMKARSKDRTIVVQENENPIFVDFWDGDQFELAKYRLVPSIVHLKRKVEDALENFNGEPGARPMNLVFFTDALEHLCRIHRIIRQPRGNALLVGLGGSGRNSLTRLSAYLAGYTMFTIEIHKKYDTERFHDDLRVLYRACGVRKQARVFYFSDNQIVNNTFLEDLNNMLSTGEVPNLFAKDDLAQIRDEISREALQAGCKDTADDMYNFFIDRARANLHLVVAMSPAHRLFRVRLRQFPALVSCTTIDWFVEWPNEALKEVAMRFLDETEFNPDEDHNEALAEMFVIMHDSTSKEAVKLKESLKRYTYVTPSSYLDLVRGYRTMLTQKRFDISEQRDKLTNGMSKLQETKDAVGQMTVELKEQDARLKEKSHEVDLATAKIQREQEAADQQQSTLGNEKVKIERENKVALAIQAEAKADLDKAQPMLDAALAALDTLRKEDVNELKAYKQPPELVMRVIGAVQVCLQQKPDWKDALKLISDPQKFLDSLKNYDKDNMTDKLLSSIEKYLKQDDFKPPKAAAVSKAAGGLCAWVIAIHAYGLVFKQVNPKRLKAEAAAAKVLMQQEQLRLKEERLAEVLARVQKLQEGLQANRDEKDRLKREAELTAEKLRRANVIVSGLEGEKDRWTTSIARYTLNIGNLVGDALLASGFLSYAGAFPAEFRTSLLTHWTKEIKKLQIPHTKSFDFVDFLVDPTEVREWQSRGLPGDDFSKENAVVVTRGTRWPLMVDPQQQAIKWIKRMEKDNFLKVIDQKQPDFLKTVENAIVNGWPVLLQDVLEEIDPSLDTIVSKAITRKGGRAMVKMGDNEIEYNDNFRMYITTRLSNPHYTPETCTKVCLLNFAVKEQGLEEQLLKVVVQRERPELEEENEQLILSTAAAKKETKQLEDEILDLLTTSKVSLLENQRLIDTLQTSKVTAQKIQKQLKEAEITSEKITSAREQFRECARRASILFFTLADLGAIDNMYQFALESYTVLFQNSIRRSAEKLGATTLEERIKTLNSWHTDQVYNNTCRGLFEKHKLLFSFHMCMKILMGRKELNLDEYAFFMKGGQVLDKQGRTPNPAPSWLSEKSWDNILDLDKLLNFHGIAAAFEQSPNDWKLWFLQEKPEEALIPGEWHNKTAESYLQRMILVRCLRPDRIVFMVYQFITDNLGKQYVEPPPFNLRDTFDESTNTIPLVFVLSPGVDPTTQLEALAIREGRNLRSLALGQGQDEPAKRQIQESAQLGGWVFLANCHLMVSWLPELEKIIDDLPDSRPHENFRLWLSSIPTPQFPIGILQKAVKMTTEPPTGMKSNMLRLYNYFTDEQFQRNSGGQPQMYRTLLFSLCYFHSVLLERRKFGTLGYNVVYDFTYSDFEVSESIIRMYLDEITGGVEAIPFVTLRYLIAEASYGGRVTDDWDRRVISTYINQFMNPKTVTEERYLLSSADEYYVPSEVATLAGFKKHCMDLPITDPPEAFGQHSNADISSQIANSNLLLENLINVNATLARSGGASSGNAKTQSVEERCLTILASLEEPSKAAIPMLIDYDAIYEATNEDRASALNTCLLQEIQRYNMLLKKIHRQKRELRAAVKGEIVMNDELDAIFNALLIGRVPHAWTSAYPSTKPLASWSVDLVERIDQMKLWGQRTPKVFWLAGFTYPTGFLKSLQQQQARRDQISIDQYGWEFLVLPSEDRTIMNAAKEGAYVRGVYLEGAGWNPEHNCICEPNPMELIVGMPIIHFKPKRREGKMKVGNVYVCPLYMYPVRTGTRERPSFVVGVDLDSGDSPPEHWTKRGTALLLSTDA